MRFQSVIVAFAVTALALPEPEIKSEGEVGTTSM